MIFLIFNFLLNVRKMGQLDFAWNSSDVDGDVANLQC